MSSSQSSKGKSRRSITNAQRKALRAWYFDTTNDTVPKKQADASAWWYETYGYHLNSSTVSELLSCHYEFLDDEDSVAATEGKRQRAPRWEALEEELMRWLVWEECVCGTAVGASALKEKATEIWLSLECYQGVDPPKWSEGWRARFKARYNLRKGKIYEDLSQGM